MAGPKPGCERSRVGSRASDPTSLKTYLATETEATTIEETQRLTREDSSTRGPMTQVGESPREASRPTNLLTMKAIAKVATWNVRTMYETGKSAQIAKEMRRYNIQLLGICESRWNGSGEPTLSTGEKVLFSGHEEEDHEHTLGVALMISPKMISALIEWEPISPRILTARFNSKGRKVTIVQCYAPTNTAKIEAKENFYQQLQDTFDRLPKRDIKILMGDLNAKIGSDNSGRELIMGTHALGEMNENGELFSDFCACNDLVIGGSLFQHKDIHKVTWVSPDGITENQIDHITIARKWRRSLLDTRAKRGADVASDHNLVLSTIRVKLRAFRDTCDRPHAKFNTLRLKEKDVREEFSITLKNKFEALSHLTQETPLEEHWSTLREVWNHTCSNTLKKKDRQDKEWLSNDTWKLIEERRCLKQQIINCQNEDQKQELRTMHSLVNKKVKKSARRDKRQFHDDLATEAETAAERRDIDTLYKITRTLSGKKNNLTKPVKNHEGKPITTESDQRKR